MHEPVLGVKHSLRVNTKKVTHGGDTGPAEGVQRAVASVTAADALQ